MKLMMATKSIDKVHLRHCILYEFQKGSKPKVALKNLLDVFGEDAVSIKTCNRWFKRFRNGDLSLKEAPRSGRPTKINDEVLQYILETKPDLTTREIAKELGVDHTTVGDHIRTLGFVRSPCKKSRYKKKKRAQPTKTTMNNDNNNSGQHIAKQEQKVLKQDNIFMNNVTMEEDQKPTLT